MKTTAIRAIEKVLGLVTKATRLRAVIFPQGADPICCEGHVVGLDSAFRICSQGGWVVQGFTRL